MSAYRRKAAEWWIEWGALVQAILFFAVFSALMIRKHDAFHTFALDLAKFDQAIWNTLHGRFLFSTLQDRSILANHFSPFMALLSPLYVFGSDVRALMMAQAAGLAVCGLFLYAIVCMRDRALAPWFALSFYLNPALHEVALTEVRRITFAMPFLALASFALAERRRGLLCLGLGLALLCKEDVSILVFMVGVYLVVFRRDWRWGGAIAAVGAVWAIVVPFWVIAAFRGQSGDLSVYPQLNYFGLSGDSYGEVIAQLWGDPLAPVRNMFDAAGLRALWRVFLPLGLAIPFLAPDWALIPMPLIAYMLMSSARGMHRLEGWYMASVLPGLFAAIGIALTRRVGRFGRVGVWVLLGTTTLGYVLYSHAPLGGKHDAALYHVGQHERMAAQAVRSIPDGARVAAQDPYVPHLSHREYIYLYPWIPGGRESVDYVLLDRRANAYPMQPPALNEEIDNLIADPSWSVELEGDGIVLFRRGPTTAPAFGVGRVAEGTIRLDRVEVALLDGDGFYAPADASPVEVSRGQTVRVSLYWEALAAPSVERTVSVRIAPTEGGVPIEATPVAQHDGLPGNGTKPTSWWEEGWKIRDVVYLSVPLTARLGQAQLDVVLYDTYSLAVVPFDGEDAALTVCQVEVRE